MKIVDPVNSKNIYIRAEDVRSAFVECSTGVRKIHINVGGEVIYLDFSRQTPDNSNGFRKLACWVDSILGGDDV